MRCTKACFLLLLCAVAPLRAQTDLPHNTGNALQQLLETDVHTEWEAFKNKDKKAYGDLLADDFIAVEDDAQGTRTKMQAVNEIENTNVSSYTLFRIEVTPLCETVALVTYEVTLRFPPRSVLKFTRDYVSEIWIKRDGRWLALHYQESRVR